MLSSVGHAERGNSLTSEKFCSAAISSELLGPELIQDVAMSTIESRTLVK